MKLLLSRCVRDLELRLADVLAGFAPVEARGDSRRVADLANADGSILVEVKAHTPGIRELHAAIAQLALCADRPEVRRAILMLWSPRLSEASARREWEALVGLFERQISSKLQLVAVWPERQLLLPEDAFMREFSLALRTAVESSATPRRKIEKRHEVLKVLLLRWLRREAPVTLGELERLAGVSFPTASKAVNELQRYLIRDSARRVALRSFPTEPWASLTVLAPRLRQTTAWMDRSGRPPDLERLAARLAQVQGPALALGGVLAARHWDPEIDLDGLPRLDVCVHAPQGALDLGFLARVDPGLGRSDDPSKTVLVVHALTRASAQFIAAAPGALPWADPVETLLDLVELRLIKQADEMVSHLRRKQ